MSPLPAVLLLVVSMHVAWPTFSPPDRTAYSATGNQVWELRRHLVGSYSELLMPLPRVQPGRQRLWQQTLHQRMASHMTTTNPLGPIDADISRSWSTPSEVTKRRRRQSLRQDYNDYNHDNCDNHNHDDYDHDYDDHDHDHWHDDDDDHDHDHYDHDDATRRDTEGDAVTMPISSEYSYSRLDASTRVSNGYSHREYELLVLTSTRTDEYELSTSGWLGLSDEYSYSRVQLVDIPSWGLVCHVEAAWQGLARRVEAAWRVGGVLHDVVGSWRVLGRGGSLACHVEVAWWGLAHRVEVTWWGLGVCWVGVVVSRWVAGSCVPCWDGMGASGGWALRAALRWRGGSAGSWHAMLGQRGLACRVGAARWVGGGRVLGQDGGGLHARMACNVQGFACCVGVAGWWWWCVASHVGQCVGAGTNGSGLRARGDGNGLQH
ncbi:hypothetical protein EDB89DRAFT_1904252 [Lactarius sanguifluus]|nr:hypothetical protein EDB89DRAFT_1904252 [Lactarius sanguifluus]